MLLHLPFLTDDEIRQIVNPLTQPAAIVRWFRQNGFENLRVKPNGMPLISRVYFDEVMGAGVTKMLEPKPQEPDVNGYMARLAARKNMPKNRG